LIPDGWSGWGVDQIEPLRRVPFLSRFRGRVGKREGYLRRGYLGKCERVFEGLRRIVERLPVVLGQDYQATPYSPQRDQGKVESSGGKSVAQDLLEDHPDRHVKAGAKEVGAGIGAGSAANRHCLCGFAV
jgi:hypothetical protein